MKTRGDNILDLIMSDYFSDVTVHCKPPLGASDATLMAEFPTQVLEDPRTKRVFWPYNLADWPRLSHFYCQPD